MECRVTYRLPRITIWMQSPVAPGVRSTVWRIVATSFRRIAAFLGSFAASGNANSHPLIRAKAT